MRWTRISARAVPSESRQIRVSVRKRGSSKVTRRRDTECSVTSSQVRPPAPSDEKR